jgi:integrase
MITANRVEAWLKKETPGKPGRMRLAFSLLRAFLNWCETQDDYRGIADPGACDSSLKGKYIPKMKPKDDCLQKEQLKAWFEAVRQLTPGMSAYLQALLLTGARRNELAGLEWDHMDFQWQSLTIHDKVAGTRTIPLTPYLGSVLYSLPGEISLFFPVQPVNQGDLRSQGSPTIKPWKWRDTIPYHTRAAAFFCHPFRVD